MATQSICKIEDCSNPVRNKVRGWCQSHYTRWRRHGDPLAGRVSNGEPERFLREVVLNYEGNDCLSWPFAKTTAGYAVINGVGYVHRFVCEEANGPAPTEKHEAAHSCGNGGLSCVTKRHLDWKTHIENMADKLVHGTSNRGERQGLSKLTETIIQEIRACTGPTKDVAEIFNISKSHVKRIRNKSTWSWLD